MPFKALSFEQVKSIAGKYSDIVIKESATGKLLFTVYGGRLLGMWPKSDGHNPLWVSPSLDQNMKTGQWMTGGERLWIAPERHFFYENPRDFEGFYIPAEIDPGEYVGTGDISFESTFSLLDYLTNETFDGSICKRLFSLIDDPYATSLPFAGVRITDTVSVPAEGLAISAWSLAQLYTFGPEQPGTAFFPVKKGGKTLSYFRPIPSDRTDVCDGYARFKIDADDIYKFAVQPEYMVFDNPCKAVYVTPAPQGDSWLACIKRSNDMPRSQDDCVDISRDNPRGPKGATQAYNHGPESSNPDQEFPAFGEIELQLNKGVSGNGRTVSTATHELLAYEGTKDQILEIAQTALNVQSTPVEYDTVCIEK